MIAPMPVQDIHAGREAFQRDLRDATDCDDLVEIERQHHFKQRQLKRHAFARARRRERGH